MLIKFEVWAISGLSFSPLMSRTIQLQFGALWWGINRVFIQSLDVSQVEVGGRTWINSHL